VLFRLDNCYIELLSPKGEGPLGGLLGAWLDAHGDSAVGLAFATSDIDACHRELHDRGLAPGPVEAGRGIDRTTGAERRWRRIALPLDRTRGVLIFPIQHDSPADALPRARADGDAAAAVHAIDHAVVQTTDADATKQLYGDGFGLRLAVDKQFPDWGVHLMFFRVAGVTVEVAAALANADAGGGFPGGATRADAGGIATEASDRIYGMSYRVASVDAARARLVNAGVDVSEVRTGRRPGTRVVTVRSHTCGVPTLLIEIESGFR
jgi:catechol 2,3-dioxygenase-like lactoylglutathione lyase family enzyme